MRLLPAGLRSRTLGLIAITALLGACASPPEYERPSSLIPAAWPRGGPTQKGQEAAAIGWREMFQDPRLQQLISRALDHNRDLRMALTRVLEARAQVDTAKADTLPSASLSASQSAAKYPGELSGSGNPIISRQSTLSVSSISYELDFWGRVSATNDAARSRLLGSEAARRALHISLIAEVSNLYYTSLELDARLSLALAALSTRERSLALTRRGNEQGAAAISDVLLIEAQLNNARAEIAVLENQRVVTEHAMKVLVGSELDQLPAGQGLLEQNIRTDLAPGIPSEVILKRPDVIAAEQRLQEARANLEAARMAFLPRILLTASLGLVSKSLAGLFQPGTGNWTYQPNISMPIFDNGRTGSYVDMAVARQEGSIADYEKTIQVAFREIADLLAARGSLANQMLAAEGVVKAHQQRLVVAEARYRAGAISHLEVLDAQRELIAAKQAMIQVRRTQLSTAAQLYKALGGGELEGKG